MVSTMNKKPHMLLVTIAFPGHFAPFVQILYHLAERYNGLTVTVLGNKDRLADLSKLQSRGDLQTLDLRLLEVFGPIPVYKADPKFPVRGPIVSEVNRDECGSYCRTLVKNKDDVGAPTAIVADMFQYWSKDLADELGIPWYTYFSTSSMFTLCALLAPVLLKEGLHPYTSPNAGKLVNIPGLTFVRIGDLPEEVLGFSEFYRNLVDRTRRATALLLNTSEELDSGAGSVIALRRLMSSSSRVLPIGPSLQYPGFGYIYSPLHTKSNCLEWLDSQAVSSVLFVAFGSLGSISKGLIMELALGLEASGVPFLWALKIGSATLSDVLPPGFEERVKGRGIIETGWAPQSRILAHPSTGGFLSHCGWNSTLESIVVGVPFITWPLSADQLMNARFLVDVEKVGVSICSSSTAGSADFYDDIDRNDVSKSVRLLMIEEKGHEVRRNASELKKSVAAAVVEGGSSYRNLHSFLEEVTSCT